MLSEAMENYLKVIYEVLERRDRASTSAIAGRLGIAAPSVTAMVKRLAEMGLVTYERYRGVRLTPVGKKAALEVVRHHRLIELYLAQALGVPWDRVHAEAEKLEHVISEDLERRMAEALGDPTHDPHGAPIPALDGTQQRIASRALTEAEAGFAGTVAEVDDRDSALLRHLAGLGVFPGTRVEVVRVEPFGGSIVLRSERGEFSLGRAAAEGIRVASPALARGAG